MKATVLFRSNRDLEEEMKICSQYFETISSRVGITNSLVIPRYSALPFYRELEHDLQLQGSKMINSYYEHNYIASFDWYYDLEKYTPKTWFSLQDVPKNGGPFVLKGRTNSRKHQWNSKMFVKDFQEAVKVHYELINDDALISQQGVVIREYVELENFGVGVNGQPFANEWRCFFYKGKLLSYGYYWVNGDIIPDRSVFDSEAQSFVQEVADILKERVNFFVVDIAKTKEGRWIVIEVNDGSMSGLSDNNPHELYFNLKREVEKS